MQITINDVRAAGFCVAGARRWFDGHGMPFNDFLKNGVDAETFLKKGDELARRVVEAKENRGG